MIVGNLGISGSRYGCTPQQIKTSYEILIKLRDRFAIIRQGACTGADEQLSMLGFVLDYRIIAHPPVESSWMSRFALQVASERLPSLPYLTRNQQIVINSGLLLACPNEMKSQRGGTWSTITFADKLALPTIIVRLDGSIEKKNNAPSDI